MAKLQAAGSGVHAVNQDVITITGFMMGQAPYPAADVVAKASPDMLHGDHHMT